MEFHYAFQTNTRSKQYYILQRSSSSSSGTRVRPASTLGFRTSESESRMQLSASRSNQDLLDSDSKWLKEWDKSEDALDHEKFVEF